MISAMLNVSKSNVAAIRRTETQSTPSSYPLQVGCLAPIVLTQENLVATFCVESCQFLRQELSTILSTYKEDGPEWVNGAHGSIRKMRYGGTHMHKAFPSDVRQSIGHR